MGACCSFAREEEGYHYVPVGASVNEKEADREPLLGRGDVSNYESASPTLPPRRVSPGRGGHTVGEAGGEPGFQTASPVLPLPKSAYVPPSVPTLVVGRESVDGGSKTGRGATAANRGGGEVAVRGEEEEGSNAVDVGTAHAESGGLGAAVLPAAPLEATADEASSATASGGLLCVGGGSGKEEQEVLGGEEGGSRNAFSGDAVVASATGQVPPLVLPQEGSGQAGSSVSVEGGRVSGSSASALRAIHGKKAKTPKHRRSVTKKQHTPSYMLALASASRSASASLGSVEEDMEVDGAFSKEERLKLEALGRTESPRPETPHKGRRLSDTPAMEAARAAEEEEDWDVEFGCAGGDSVALKLSQDGGIAPSHSWSAAAEEIDELFDFDDSDEDEAKASTAQTTARAVAKPSPRELMKRFGEKREGDDDGAGLDVTEKKLAQRVGRLEKTRGRSLSYLNNMSGELAMVRVAVLVDAGRRVDLFANPHFVQAHQEIICAKKKQINAAFKRGSEPNTAVSGSHAAPLSEREFLSLMTEARGLEAELALRAVSNALASVKKEEMRLVGVSSAGMSKAGGVRRSRTVPLERVVVEFARALAKLRGKVESCVGLATSLFGEVEETDGGVAERAAALRKELEKLRKKEVKVGELLFAHKRPKPKRRMSFGSGDHVPLSVGRRVKPAAWKGDVPGVPEETARFEEEAAGGEEGEGEKEEEEEEDGEEELSLARVPSLAMERASRLPNGGSKFEDGPVHAASEPEFAVPAGQ